MKSFSTSKLTRLEKLSAFLDNWCCDKDCLSEECLGVQLIFKHPPMYAWALSVVDFWRGETNGKSRRRSKIKRK